MRVVAQLSFECSSMMATGKTAWSPSMGCSTADAGRSCLHPKKRREKWRLVDGSLVKLVN